MKSLARDGERDEGGWGGRGTEVMTKTLRPPTDTNRHTIDHRPSNTA